MKTAFRIPEDQAGSRQCPRSGTCSGAHLCNHKHLRSLYMLRSKEQTTSSHAYAKYSHNSLQPSNTLYYRPTSEQHDTTKFEEEEEKKRKRHFVRRARFVSSEQWQYKEDDISNKNTPSV